jgi:hypothetical protein
MIRFFACSIFGSLILAACAGAGDNQWKMLASLSTQSVCKFSNEVEVRVIQTTSGDKVIVAKPDPLCPHPGAEVELAWKVMPEKSSYVFANPDGITIVGGATVFKCARDQDARVFKCKNKNTKGTYKYNIKLTNGSSTLTSDPIVINGFEDENPGL